MKVNTNILKALGVLVIFLLGFLFFKIVIYLGISMVLFLIGVPITNRLEKIKLGKKHMPPALAAIITLLIILSVFGLLFYMIVPPLVYEINFLAELNFVDVLHNIMNQYPSLTTLLHKFGNESELEASISKQLSHLVNAGNISTILNHTLSYMGAAVGGILCTLFITFFLLKDEKLIRESVLLLSPSGTESDMSKIIITSKQMLSRYFAALFIDMLIVGVSAMIVLSIMGIKNALIIAFCAGLLNVIPYIGAFITMSVAILLGVSACISSGSYELIGPTITKLFFGLLSINLIDAFLIQPVLFSNSVKAHPLEIFLVTLMAASLGGVFGMVIALPVYTLIRIVAKQFLAHLKFFKRISDTI